MTSPTKKILLLVLVLFSVQNTFAQFNLQLGYTIYPLKAPGFQTFFYTYNQANASGVSTPFKADFPTASGWTWKIGYKIPKEEGGVSFYYNSSSGVNHLVTHNEFVFQNGEKRKIALKCRDWTTDVALGAGGKVFYAAAVGSVTLRFNKLYSSYVFADGTESFGLEHGLNGVYDASRIMAGYGLEAGVGTGIVKVVGKIHKIYKPFLKDGSTYLNYYNDLVQYKSGYNPTPYFPADMAVFNKDPLASSELNNFVYINDYGWEMTIALQIMLNFNKD